MSTEISIIARALEAASSGGRLPRVKWWHRSGSFNSIYRHGRVQRATGSTIWVVQDGGTEAISMRANRNGIVDVDLLTAHELAIEAWAADRPVTKLIQVQAAGLGEHIAYGADLRIWVDAEAIRKLDPVTALSEMSTDADVLRQWVKLRPQTPEG